MAGQGKGAVRRSRHIVGGGGTTLFLAGVAVGCVLTWSTQRPESIPNPLRATYQDRASGEESAFPPSPTYEFYTVLPEGGMDPAAQSEPSVLALEADQEEDALIEDANADPTGDSSDEDERAKETSQQALKTAVPSEPNSDIQAARPSAEEAPSVAPSATALPDSVDREAEDPPSPLASSDSLEEMELASIQKPEDDPPARDAPSRYVIQVGSFKELSEVETTKASLILMGFRVMVQSMSIDGGAPWHRIRVGPYESLSQTEGARDRLESEGFRAIVLKGQRG